MRTILLLAVCLATIGLVAVPAGADLYNFASITEENDPSWASWFSVDISAVDSSGVAFTFFNNAPAYDTAGYQTAITDVYFYDGALLGNQGVSLSGDGTATSWPFVYFTEASVPGEMQLPGFDGGATRVFYAANAERPPTSWPDGWGVHGGESLTVTFSGVTLSDVLASLDLSGSKTRGADDTLQIGLKAQALPGDASGGYVVTPLPSAALLGLLGLGAAGLKLRRMA